MDLKRRAFGLALGTLLGLSVFIGTCWLLIIDSQGDFFSKFSSFFFGYSITWLGAFIGFLWGFVYGFFFGGLLAWLYNIFSRVIYSNR
jgi:hypothetical protein